MDGVYGQTTQQDKISDSKRTKWVYLNRESHKQQQQQQN